MGIFKRIKNRALRITAVIVTIVIIAVAIVIAFVSPIAKYLIEKNSVKYTGRQMKMSWLYVNPFTGHIHAHNFVVYEKATDKKFLSVGDLSLNISLPKLWHKSYYVYSVTLDKFWVNIIENKTAFNFDDLFKTDSTKKHTDTSTLHYYVRDIKMLNSEVVYSEVSIPVHYSVTKLNIESPGIEWDSAAASFKYDFNFLQNSGFIHGLFKMDFKKYDYDMGITFEHFDMTTLGQYLKEFSNYGYFKAMLNADVKAKGNFHDASDLLATGKVSINDFHFGKSVHEDYLRFGKLLLTIDSLSPLNKKYFFKTVALDSFYVKYEQYDTLDNISRLFGIKGANVQQASDAHYNQNIVFQIAHYISEIAQDAINSQYRIDSLQVTNASALYNDYSLAETFSIGAGPIIIHATNIDTRAKRIYATLQTTFNPYGVMNIQFDVKPTNFEDFHMVYNITNFPVPLINPYSITYTSYPFNRGAMGLNGEWDVNNGIVVSKNHFVVINPTLSNRVREEDATKLPMKFILFLARDMNRRTDIDLPITGNLKNPKYHFHSAILFALRNLLIKPPTSPYRSVKIEQKHEKDDYVSIEWQFMQSKLSGHQREQLRKIAFYMSLHPTTRVSIAPFYYEDKEKEKIVLFEAKKMYYAALNHLKLSQITTSDSEVIIRMAKKDSAFRQYIDRMSGAKDEFTTQGKCYALVGRGRVQALYNALLAERKKQMMAFFTDRQVADRLVFTSGMNIVPATGFSHYLFYYKGDKPKGVDEENTLYQH